MELAQQWFLIIRRTPPFHECCNLFIFFFTLVSWERIWIESWQPGISPIVHPNQPASRWVFTTNCCHLTNLSECVLVRQPSCPWEHTCHAPGANSRANIKSQTDLHYTISENIMLHHQQTHTKNQDTDPRHTKTNMEITLRQLYQYILCRPMHPVHCDLLLLKIPFDLTGLTPASQNVSFDLCQHLLIHSTWYHIEHPYHKLPSSYPIQN